MDEKRKNGIAKHFQLKENTFKNSDYREFYLHAVQLNLSQIHANSYY